MFLDEVGELPLATQVKLLRVLEDRKVMALAAAARTSQSTCASSPRPTAMSKVTRQGGFRQDLYFRLNGITLPLPPLRQRPADIAALARSSSSARRPARHGAARDARAVGGAIAVLERYDCPGNIRELSKVIERAVLLCDGTTIEPAHLPPKLTASAPTPLPPAPAQGAAGGIDPRARLLGEIERLDRQRIIEALARCGGNQTHAAEQLGMSRRTLVTRLHVYDLPRPRKRSTES